MKQVCPHCGKEFETKKIKKGYKSGVRDPVSRIELILKYLKAQENWVWIRRIAKETKLKPYSVSYLIEKYLTNYIEILEPEDVYASTGIKMKMIKLINREIDIKKILDEIKLRINS